MHLVDSIDDAGRGVIRDPKRTSNRTLRDGLICATISIHATYIIAHIGHTGGARYAKIVKADTMMTAQDLSAIVLLGTST